jgi:hypothetical protein
MAAELRLGFRILGDNSGFEIMRHDYCITQFIFGEQGHLRSISKSRTILIVDSILESLRHSLIVTG